MICPICDTKSSIIFHKPLVTTDRYNYTIKILSGIAYSKCPNCKCCFTLDEFTPETHNQGSDCRNIDPINIERLRRIRFFNQGYRMIDFGCGKGQFTDLAKKNGYMVTPIDQDTDIQLSKLKSDRYNIINCVEVIEHIVQPKEVIEDFHRVLKPGGIVYLESSFTDFLGETLNSEYIDPNIGHVLVHSRKSIELLFQKFEVNWLNNNVCIFKKI